MKLTAENVKTIFLDCLYRGKELTVDCVRVDGIMNVFGFIPGRLKKHRDEIYEILKQLPEGFQKESGGGMTFLNACSDKEGNMWTGLHTTMEQLMTLGMAIDKVKYCMPRDMWMALPGGMPYFVVN